MANLPRLVALAGALGLDPDHFYVHIIQQLVRRHTEAAQQQRGRNSTAGALHLGPGDRAMLSAVRKHLSHIRDPQLRVDTAQWWAGQVADGLAKVEAYDLVRACARGRVGQGRAVPGGAGAESDTWWRGGQVMRLATEWHEELLPTDAGFKLAPIAAEAARVAHTLRDRHRTALDVRSLAPGSSGGGGGGAADDASTEALLEFLDNPRELVCQIFHAHAAAAARELQQRHAGLGVTTRDGMEVHRVATGIAQRHGVDMLKVKRLLIQHWVFEDLAPDATATGVGSASASGGGSAARGRTAGAGDGGSGTAGDAEGADGGAGVGAGFSVFEPSPFEVAQEAEAEAELKIVYALLPTDSDLQDAQDAAGKQGSPSSAGSGAGAGAASASSDLVMSGAKALLNVATMRQSSKRSYRSRARAVSCVFRLLDSAAINSIYAAGAQALSSYWRYCLCVLLSAWGRVSMGGGVTDSHLVTTCFTLQLHG